MFDHLFNRCYNYYPKIITVEEVETWFLSEVATFVGETPGAVKGAFEESKRERRREQEEEIEEEMKQQFVRKYSRRV